MDLCHKQLLKYSCQRYCTACTAHHMHGVSLSIDFSHCHSLSGIRHQTKVDRNNSFQQCGPQLSSSPPIRPTIPYNRHRTSSQGFGSGSLLFFLLFFPGFHVSSKVHRRRRVLPYLFLGVQSDPLVQISSSKSRCSPSISIPISLSAPYPK